MTAYTIRRATAADVPYIVALGLEAATAAHWPAAEYERIFVPGSVPRTALVIEEEGRIAGFIVARCVNSDWELENIAVEHASQRRGFGRALVERLLQFAHEASVAHVFLEVRESNQAARRLYSQLGFLETGRRPIYYSHPVEDAITYEIVIGI